MTQKKYIPAEIEKKWQEKWERDGLHVTPDLKAKSSKLKAKKYILDMFPYPSGAGLHVGHMEGYVATDVISRYMRMKGFAVLHPMGWDAFGLPAENYAINNGIAPDKSTHENIKNFKYQLQLLGLSYDWLREIDTSSPDYYKWTQWLFIQLFKKGLAYKKKAPANWCPKDETVLANEQVVDGKCERCGTEVVQKELDQWFFKITQYADRLIEGLDKVDWPESTKQQQVNWIGRKEGINIRYPITHDQQSIKNKFVEVFTTRPDTNFGATFVVLAPEHPLVSKITTDEHKAEVDEYVRKAKTKKEVERAAEGRKKTGVFTGAYAVNQLNDYKMPIWVSDFVLSGFGTGALVGVPGHDLRDFEFAQQFGLEIKRVVVGRDGDNSEITQKDQVQEENGKMVHSEFLDGLNIHEATLKMMDFLEEKSWGKRVVTYHIRDWLISRQRYWGCPIPMIFCDKDGWNPVSDAELPITLPIDIDFRPSGESPIARSESFKKDVKCPVCGGEGKREVDTMDTYVDSSWYFYRFVDPQNKTAFASQEALESWMPVDIYVGGGHVVQHLLFARFFHKVLVDAGYIKEDGVNEPFLKLRAPGWILGPDSRKMSKRWGNVITPEEVVAKHGADAMRTYEMFMAPFEVDKPWNVNSVAGVERFLARINSVVRDNLEKDIETSQELKNKLAKLVLKVGNDIETFRFNTAIAAMMEFLNAWEKSQGMSKSDLETFVKILAPFAPHLSEELWQQMRSTDQGLQTTVMREKKFESIHQQKWPMVDEQNISDQSVTLVVSVNGKIRAILEIDSETSEEEAVKMAKDDNKVANQLEGKEIKKVVYVPGKILNFVL